MSNKISYLFLILITFLIILLFFNTQGKVVLNDSEIAQEKSEISPDDMEVIKEMDLLENLELLEMLDLYIEEEEEK